MYLNLKSPSKLALTINDFQKQKLIKLHICGNQYHEKKYYNKNRTITRIRTVNLFEDYLK